ncbi:MAG: hypothetical protein Q9214_005522, partial [Letrouitia sp. 1 TL-2023]
LAAPKSKYVERILVATHAGEAGVAEVFRTLQHRLRDSTWTIVFKALIIVHLMIREGEPNVTLKFLGDAPSKMAISNFSDVQVQGSNIRHYYSYLLTRAKSYRDTRLDWIREGQGRLKRQTVEKGLLRETESVQSQINALVKCDILDNDPENEITLTAFRLLTMDLLILFHIMNEGTINVLEHYFEMSKYDAERALSIYKVFSRQTNQVVGFLSTARRYENATRLEIPKLKHAPTGLTSSLEEYLNDPDFEINRRQYLAQQEAKKGKKPSSNGATKSANQAKKTTSSTSGTKDFPEPKAATVPAAKIEAKGPAPDLIDFFDSIEQNQQPMATQPQQQMSVLQNGPQNFQQQQQPPAISTIPNFFSPTGQSQQQMPGSFGSSNPFGQNLQQEQPNFTGNGYTGYVQQQSFPQPQQNFPQQSDQFADVSQTSVSQPFTFQQQPFSTAQQPFSQGPQPQSTNPFRQTHIQTGPANSSFSNSSTISSPLSQQSTNPFARNIPSQMSGPSPNSSSPFQSPPPQQQQPPTQPLQSTRTGTNPFARNISPLSSQYSTPPTLAPNTTGSTNPFRQSTFVNQQTGQGWQGSQRTMGGLEQLETVPIFPRPGQLPQQQQQPWP